MQTLFTEEQRQMLMEIRRDRGIRPMEYPDISIPAKQLPKFGAAFTQAVRKADYPHALQVLGEMLWSISIALFALNEQEEGGEVAKLSKAVQQVAREKKARG